MSLLVPIIIGPTAIGKTKLSLLLAKHYPAEIISADSRQIYKLMDIGTAKPSAEELKQIKHHFISMLDPSENFSSGQYSKLARSRIDEIHQLMRTAIVVGGSGFYIKALVDGIIELEIEDSDLRDELKKRIAAEGSAKLHMELAKHDPELALRLKMNDRQRILRGLEVFYSSGQKLSELQKKEPEKAAFYPLFIGLTMNREKLYMRINRRVEAMFAKGLLEEVRKLEELGYHKGMNALNTVGYKEVFNYLEDNGSYEEMIELIKRNTRRYAKRQYTWFNNDSRIQWFNLDNYSSFQDLADECHQFIQSKLKRI